MFIAKKLGDSIDKQTRRRTVTVKFTDGISEFERDFSFSIETDTIKIKKIIKGYLDEINLVPDTLADGNMDFTDIAEPAPEAKAQKEIDKEEWQALWNKLESVQPLIKAGVFTGNEPVIVNLRNKLKADFKPAYLDLI